MKLLDLFALVGDDRFPMVKLAIARIARITPHAPDPSITCGDADP